MTLRVLIATPLGQGGNGGIDRLMDGLRGELARPAFADVTVTFGVTRGQGSIRLAPVFLARFLALLVRQRAAGKVDLVHINLASDGSFYRKVVVARLARALGVPYVIHLHGAFFQVFYDEGSPRLRRAIERMFRGASTLIALGTTWQHFMRRVAPDTRVVILPNATAHTATPPRANLPEPVRIAFLGQLGARKGVPELVTAAAALADMPGWSMTIAGDGAIAETRARVAELGLGDQVDVPGWLGPEHSAALLAGAQIVVLPSHAENLPMSVIEGMGAGAAVVTTPVGATADIVEDGVTGLLVPPGDATALADALRRVVTDGELRARLGAAAQAAHRARLSFESFGPALVRIWREAAGRQG